MRAVSELSMNPTMRIGSCGLVIWLATLASGCGPGTPTASTRPSFQLVEADIETIQRAMSDGAVTARRLTELYLQRIATRNPELRAIIETNPDALEIADRLDDERRAGYVRGPLHGIPLVVKDTIETQDRMQSAAGSLAMVGIPVQQDAFVVQQLRQAGVIILGKANLTEWGGTGRQLGWSSRGGQVKNPYAADRSPLGSSAGSAAAATANLAAAALGGETMGSIVGPAAFMGSVGFKTTAGLVSRRGTVPAVLSIDSIGPITRTVRDAAVVLSAIAAKDERDPQAIVPGRPGLTDFVNGLSPDGLRGVRLGVVRDAGLAAESQPLYERAIADLQTLGAIVVEAEIPADYDGERLGAAFETWFFTELGESLGSYVPTRPGSTLKSVADIMSANRRLTNEQRPLEWMGQWAFDLSMAKLRRPAATRQRDLEYLAALDREKGLDALLVKYSVDGLISGFGPASPLAGPPPPMPNLILLASLGGGAPLLTVPMGQVNGLPVGLLFGTRRWGDERLLRWAYAYEQRTRHRVPPTDPVNDGRDLR